MTKKILYQKWLQSAIVALCFLSLFLIGLNIFRDYGSFTDELMEVETAGINLKYVAAKLFPNWAPPMVPTFDWETLPHLPDYEDKTYGATVMAPTLLVNLLPGVHLGRAQFLNFRRLYCFLNFFLALMVFYALLRLRYRNFLTPLIGFFMLTLSPRFFAESFYNVKDLIFFSWFMICLCSIGWYMLTRRRLALAAFCLSFGLAANTRNFGVVLLPAFMVALLIDFFRADKAQRATSALRLMLTAIAASLTYYVFTPSLWEDPLREFIVGLRFSAAQSGIGDAELFMGRILAPRDVWYYLPVWMAITIPLLYQAFFAFKLIALGREIYRRKVFASLDGAYLFDAFCLCLFLFSMGGVILLRATIYHGWRQCYFLYAPWIWLAVGGADAILRLNFSRARLNRIKQPLAIGLCLASFIHTGVWMKRNHPLDFAYFNEIGSHFASNFSRDYWGVGSMSCVRELAERYSGRELVLGVNSDLTWGSAEFTLMRLPDAIQRRFRVVWKDKNADYLCYSYKHTLGNDHAIPGFRRVKTWRIDRNYDVVALYQRDGVGN